LTTDSQRLKQRSTRQVWRGDRRRQFQFHPDIGIWLRRDRLPEPREAARISRNPLRGPALQRATGLVRTPRTRRKIILLSDLQNQNGKATLAELSGLSLSWRRLKRRATKRQPRHRILLRAGHRGGFWTDDHGEISIRNYSTQIRRIETHRDLRRQPKPVELKIGSIPAQSALSVAIPFKS